MTRVRTDEISIGEDLLRVERREAHLWALTLLLVVIFLTTTLVTLYLVLGGEAASFTFDRPSTFVASIGLVVLTILFCVYVFQSRGNFSQMRRILSAQAIRDPLTGLLNRQAFDDRIGIEISRADRNEGLLAFLLCDLDNFKEVNDNLGHQAGDLLLQQVSDRLQELTRGSDLVFRWGGDEMLVLLTPTSRTGVIRAAERLLSGVREIETTETRALEMSVGVALYPEHGDDPDRLLHLADRALYIAKRGGGKIHIGEEQYPVDETAVNLVFQPVVNSDSKEILGYEGLSRDPREELSIEELFQRYKAVGQLTQLKELIFRMQLREAARLELGRIFLNVDLELLGRTEPEPKPDKLEVVLELSERDVVHDVEKHIAEAERWRRLGYKFAIDDFGSGFISLPFIAQLVPNFIKMNRSTIMEAVESAEFSRFLKDLLVAMRNYSPDGVIAEGIETEEELEAARGLGVFQVQGYLTGRPQRMV